MTKDELQLKEKELKYYEDFITRENSKEDTKKDGNKPGVQKNDSEGGKKQIESQQKISINSIYNSNGSINYDKLRKLSNKISRGLSRILSPYIGERSQISKSKRRTNEATLILEGNRRAGGRNLGITRKTKSEQEKTLKEYATNQRINKYLSTHKRIRNLQF